MANVGGLRACVDLVTLLVCCNLLARTSQPDVIVVTQAPPHTGAAGGGAMPALLCSTPSAVPTSPAMDRDV